jgi:imidazole glycerol-phosphate synthase subunit HisH
VSDGQRAERSQVRRSSGVTTRPRVAVLDYGAGNLRSAEKSLQRAGADAFVTDDPGAAREADALVVPGVGHFGACVRQFKQAGLEDVLREKVTGGTPVLGICVGMQILYARSEEDPDAEGLGILPGEVRRLPAEVRVPHMGWDTLTVRRDDPVTEGLDGERCYFVHSYYADPADDEHVIATSDYGPGFPSVVRVRNVVGTQFHPEKSADVGRRLLENFVASI